MKKCLLCICAGLVFHLDVISQYYFYDATHLEPAWRLEAGISMGIMNCLTDLGGHKGNGDKFIKDVNWNASRLCSSIFLEVIHRDLIGVRLEFVWGKVTASDSVLKNDESVAALRCQRNLHFKSKIRECLVLIEWHPLLLFQSSVPTLSPYLIGGVGYLHFEPKAYLENAWVSLQPMHTEGQGFIECPERPEYSLQQIEFPFGIGLKQDISSWGMFRIEFLYRLLVTDYLDDVSTNYIEPSLFYKYYPADKARTAALVADRMRELDPLHQTTAGSIRGNPRNNDAFFSFNCRLSIVLNRKRI